MIVGVPKESFPGERRVALVPLVVPNLPKPASKWSSSRARASKPAIPTPPTPKRARRLCPDRAAVFAQADIITQVLCYGSNDRTGKADIPLLRRNQLLIGFLRPLGSKEIVQEIAATGVTSFAVELMPRTTRAQSMDALSSMATVCGYKAVIIAADTLPKLFPMLTTAAGTITPARVLIIGCGVAGLQAIATAKRLGAVVSAYDLRPAVKEQVQSLGGRFVELPIEAKDAQDARGYATAQDEAFYARQRELLGRVMAESDVVITAAVVPGKKSPVLVTAQMVQGMQPGSVIVDLAAERGGNCELTRSEEIISVNGVNDHRPHQSGEHRALSREPDVRAQPDRVSATLMVKKGQLDLNMQDEIIRETLLTRGGEDGATARARIFPVAGAGRSVLRRKLCRRTFSRIFTFSSWRDSSALR